MRGVIAGLAALACAGAASAEEAPLVEPVEVIATTPLDPSGVAYERLPAAAASLDAADLERMAPASLLRTLEGRLGGVALTHAQANAFQPNLFYRGFEASPLAGNPQGLAVYVGGARFNQPFGDTVSWDLIPDVAVERIELTGSNPAFGLNALGGALSVRLKDGDSFRGVGIEATSGAFGRRQGSLQAGGASGAFSAYAALAGLGEDGWRDHSPSELRQGYAVLGWRGEASELSLSLLAADNDLTGNGPAPVELLAQARDAVFTHPDRTQSKFARVLLSGSHRLDAAWSLGATAYAAGLRQRTANGDAAEIEGCDEAPGLLCLEDDDEPLTDVAGRLAPDILGEGYALLNHTRTVTDGRGVAVQLTGTAPLAGRPNRLAVGASYDAARTSFVAGSTLGAFSDDRGFERPFAELDLEGGEIGPVAVTAKNAYWAVYASDTLDLTETLTLTVSARYGWARVKLRDRLGDELNGDHRFERFNPAAGLAWRIGAGVSAYAGYAEANRAPTPAELSCADPEAPCSLTNFFVSDPPLKQVVTRTWEAGLRGGRDLAGGRLDWRAGLYRTDASDDIQMVASEITGRGYFTNVGKTRREGLEAGFTFRTGRLFAYADYAWTRATYRSAFVLSAGANPAFEDEGDPMLVEPGDRRPGMPAHNLKLGIEASPTDALSLGLDVQATSGRVFVGDEANLNPKTDGYVVADLHAEWRAFSRISLFATVQNLLGEDYATFGTFAPVDEVPGLDLDDPASVSPGAPRALFVGVRARF